MHKIVLNIPAICIVIQLCKIRIVNSAEKVEPNKEAFMLVTGVNHMMSIIHLIALMLKFYYYMFYHYQDMHNY